MVISGDWWSTLLFESNNYNTHFHQEKVFKNIEALVEYLSIYTCLMFESANLIDKVNSHKSHYHKASKAPYKCLRIHLKLIKLANSATSDSISGKCNKFFINNALKWYHVLIYSKIL